MVRGHREGCIEGAELPEAIDLDEADNVAQVALTHDMPGLDVGNNGTGIDDVFSDVLLVGDHGVLEPDPPVLADRSLQHRQCLESLATGRHRTQMHR